ncbi:LysR family transcriptional regulator [Falsirhodobacter algicola]|uniref:LysR family transcriptional regulator n=1 Tax=Falsirhodobacter algicola TaxID=2692330 RepID=A0A8J8MSD9_9RHOB|nr:LysR family transcriptional regulator [Falsirhodobacter algicola]QUS35870.1 LysR family transcriptional regulator [Falsirhodobacter algicola]
MGFDNWDEVRTAFQVARLGTVSGAAEALGVHHATVIRHVDALERRLGTKLFQRHARGYTPTEAGRDLLSVAQTTEEQFGQLASRIRGQGEMVAGELVITAITGVAELVMPVLADFQQQHPALTVRFLSDMRIFRLDYGEAHVAIRAGAAPEEPDNVAQPLARIRSGLFASRDYIERHGMPDGLNDMMAHRFITAEGPISRAPFHRWLTSEVPADRIRVRVSESRALEAAVTSGAGIGFLTTFQTAGRDDLVEVLPPRPEWDAPLWAVTHVDLHRTLKVQAFLQHLKAAARTWT